MPTLLELDHLVVAAERLDDGVAYVQDTLGVELAGGGKHPDMSTHNRLLGLGGVYLEVIAIDPDAPAPGRARWFDLDNFSGAPRLTNWVAKTTDLSAALKLAPRGIGTPAELSRDDLTWTVAISSDGTLPFDGAFPGLIDWGSTPHPTTRLADCGCSLQSFSICHPKGDALADALAVYEGGLDQNVVAAPLGFKAEVMTPSGLKVLR